MSIAGAGSRTFASLSRHRNYRLWFGGQVVSLSGTWMQNIAQAWLIVELTHGSPFAVGALALCQFGPYGILGLLGGAFADRLRGRRALMFTQSSSMLVAIALAVLALTHTATVWEVFALAAVSGCILILDTPVRQAFTIEMVGRSELPNAIALNSSLFNASRIVGPALAGLLIATAGVGVCFLLNAVSFLAVVGALLAMCEEDLFKLDRGNVSPPILRGIGEGLAYAWRTPTVRLVLVMMLVISTLATNFNVLLPVLTTRTLHSGPEVFGALSAAFGVGALGGALTSASLSRASLKLVVLGGSAFGATMMLLALQTTVAGACSVLVLVGFSFSIYGSQSNASLQMAVSDRLRGRLMSLYGYVFFGTAPLGGMFTGWLTGTRGTALFLVIVGGVSVIAALVGVLSVRRTALPRRRATSRLGGGDASTITARE